jgi:hypothetical protein
MRNSRIQFNSIYEDPLEDRHSLAATRAADSSVKEKNKKKEKEIIRGGRVEGLSQDYPRPVCDRSRLSSIRSFIDAISGKY